MKTLRAGRFWQPSAVALHSLLVTFALSVGAWLANVSNANGQGAIQFTNLNVYLNGACEVPPNNSTYTATAVFAYNSVTFSPTNNISVAFRLSGPSELSPTAAGIHGPAAVGQNGPTIFDFGQPSIITNVSCTVELDPKLDICTTNVTFLYTNEFWLTPQQLSQLNGGFWYLNITSAAYPEGEIRGQLPGNRSAVLSQISFRSTMGSTFSVTAKPSAAYQIEASSDLATWFPITNVYTTNALFQVSDPDATNYPQRFYRVTAHKY